MSRTDKTDPGWLKEYLYGQIRHDHRSGVCVEESFEKNVLRGGYWSVGRNHWRVCPRREVISRECPCDATCWHWTRARWQAISNHPWDWEQRINVLPHRHEHVLVHQDWPCTFCDTKIPLPTCERHIPMGYVSLTSFLSGDGPSREDRNVYEAAARRDTRDALRVAARDYNANGDTDIEPEPIRHRHVARWNWW